jgi:hypothetical protein
MACLIGVGPKASVIIVGHNKTVATSPINTPLVEEINACTTVKDLQNLTVAVLTATSNNEAMETEETTTTNKTTTVT